MIKYIKPALAIAALIASGATTTTDTAFADEDSKQISLGQYTKLHHMIRPQPGECLWLDGGIEWIFSQGELQRRAAKEGKPILLWHVGGAGYRDGLGRC